VQANGKGALSMGTGAAGDFELVSYGAAGPMWWSPDLGYIHGDSNSPMRCNCIAACGSEGQVKEGDIVDIVL